VLELGPPSYRQPPDALAGRADLLSRLRRTFAHACWRILRPLEAGQDIHTVQEFLGHAGVSTPIVYTHVLNPGGRGVRSPLDRLASGIGQRRR
jgi:integrase